MSTSATRYGTRRNRRCLIVWLGVTAFCILFEVVYAHYGHGVSSPYMTLLFLYPLLGGAVVFGILHLLRKDGFPRVGYNAYNAGLATLATGSAVHGVFEIAGTSSPYQVVFTIVGCVLVAFSIIFSLISARRGSDGYGRTYV